MPRVFLILPSQPSADTGALMELAVERSVSAGYKVKTFRARRLVMYEETTERRVDFLEPDDANGIYRTVHEDSVLVLAPQKTYVRRDPSRNPPARRVALELESFVRYKAVFGLVQSAIDVKRQLRRFELWNSAPAGCNGLDDPRALPLHVFEVSEDWDHLDTELGRDEFQEQYGQSSRRRDAGGRTWNRANHFHAPLRQIVARHELPSGGHWEVSIGKGKTSLCTCSEVWQLQAGPHRYANVYPNGHVRIKKGAARLVWTTARGK